MLARDPIDVSPCPVCGYDLRGHPDETRCPECGRQVTVSLAVNEICRWVDTKMLDLRSIALLQVIGLTCGSIGLVAIRAGQYVALILCLAGGVYIAAATVWYLLAGPGVWHRLRSPISAALGHRRRRRLWRWAIADTGLVLLVPIAAWWLA